MSGDITDDEIEMYERDALDAPDTLERQRIAWLCSEVRRLRHELADPNYHYVGERIHRQAILTRNGEIDRLHAEVAELNRQLAESDKAPAGGPP